MHNLRDSDDLNLKKKKKQQILLLMVIQKYLNNKYHLIFGEFFKCHLLIVKLISF